MPKPRKIKAPFNSTETSAEIKGRKLIDILSTPKIDSINFKEAFRVIDEAFRLIDQGARLDLCDSDGWTALMLACLNTDSWRNDSRRLVEALVRNGAELNAQSHKMQEAPLHIAVEMNREKFVEILIKAGADVNIRKDNGFTPLMCAVACSSTPVVFNLLLDADAETALTSNNGATAASLAQEKGLNSLVTAIERQKEKLQESRNSALRDCYKTSRDLEAPKVKIRDRQKIKFSL